MEILPCLELRSQGLQRIRGWVRPGGEHGVRWGRLRLENLP